jgi:hypothetical protein
MDSNYKKDNGIDELHAALLQESLLTESAQHDTNQQQQVHLFDQQYQASAQHGKDVPHAPIDQCQHQHAPNHSSQEHTTNSRRYLRDPDTGLWLNQVRSSS